MHAECRFEDRVHAYHVPHHEGSDGAGRSSNFPIRRRTRGKVRASELVGGGLFLPERHGRIDPCGADGGSGAGEQRDQG